MISIFWFRRDLRLSDNAGLYHALRGPNPVLGLFIFDREILDDLSDKSDPRVTFIHSALFDLKNKLESFGSSLKVIHGNPVEVWQQLLSLYPICAVYTNRDYEPYAKNRDESIKSLLDQRRIPFHTFKDHIIFEKNEVLKDDGKPYHIFTPYSRKWIDKLNSGAGKPQEPGFYLSNYPTEKYFSNFYQIKPYSFPSLSDIGFQSSTIKLPPSVVNQQLIRNYAQTRNYPAQNGTSRLGIHFRFGTISIREKAAKAIHLSEVYFRELIWRDYYSQILDHYPFVVKQAFNPRFRNFPYRDAPDDFERWKNGETGFPIVDAGMRELNNTGFMHNRVRMIVACFLIKDLMIDWREGEHYFAEKLLDYELATNNGSWQWSAGCGADANPAFRVFNPAEQTRKFDRNLEYIRQWVPEFDTPRYPSPIVEHDFARNRYLEALKTIKPEI